MGLSSNEGKHPHEEQPVDDESIDFTKKSPGVGRIEALTEHITIWNRICIFFGVFLIAYAYSLDGILRYAYQPTATSSFHTHSMAGTIKVITSVVAAAGQPTAAKIADVFGRVELTLVSVFFYVIGTIVEATCSDWGGFAAGAVLYQIGYTCVVLLVEVIVADTTSTRSRLFFSYIPASPFIINTWVSGNISQAVLEATTWRWGVGMWCIIYTVCSLPLIISLWWVGRKARRSGALANYKTPFQLHGGKHLSTGLFWQLDIPGLVLLVLVFGFILVPLTIAGGESEQWDKAKIIAPLVIGFLLVPIWILWESRAPAPMVPFHLMKDRAVWGAVAIAITFNFAWTCQGDFLYTVLVVGFNESIKSATRITSLYSFVSVITGLFLGMVVYRVRFLKPFIMAGTALFMVAFGLLIHYRGGIGGTSHNGIIGAQILLGIAGGLFPYPAQASIQAATKHEHVAVITGVYLASYNIGSALGNTVSTAIWTQVLPRELARGFGGDRVKSAQWYGSPLMLIATNPPGTPDRDVVIQVYMHMQRLLCITGVCICVPLIFFACVIRNPKLNNQQSLPDAESGCQSVSAPEIQDTESRRSKSAFWRR